MIECKCGKSFCFYCGRDFYSCKCHSPIPLTKKCKYSIKNDYIYIYIL